MRPEKKPHGRPAFVTAKLTFSWGSEAVRQLDELAEALNLSRSSVAAQAVAKWYHSEPIIQQRRGKKRNGNSDP